MAIQITEVFYPHNRQEWRDWLEHNHQNKTEIWLQLFKKATGKPTLPYDDMVEECLCFGWIDGIVKKYDEDSRVQRITPRRAKKSHLSELNRQRFWKLQHLGLITPAGYHPSIIEQIGSPTEPLAIPSWIEEQLQIEAEVWESFQAFGHFYKRLKIGWIKEAGTSKSRLPEAKRRLGHLVKMTKAGKEYGTQPLKGLNILS